MFRLQRYTLSLGPHRIERGASTMRAKETYVRREGSVSSVC